jgi:protein associated with RNAse G/E
MSDPDTQTSGRWGAKTCAPTAVTVRSLKHDGRVHRSWEARVRRLEGSLVVLEASFAEEVRHEILGTIEAGTHSLEFFWSDRWYSVFRFGERDGRLRCFYCNVNTPARLEGDTLSFVDLDVDLLVLPDFSFRVLDEDEFEENARLYGYTEELRARVRDSLDEIIRLVEARRFPFD